MRTFTRKGYGRIYVQKSEDIGFVREMVKRMDEFEYEYLPEKLIGVFEEYPVLCFTHKFDSLDLDELATKCWALGVPILVIDNGSDEFIGIRV